MRGDRNKPLVPIPREKLSEMVGKAIHLLPGTGRMRGCVWILEKIEGDVMHLRTPVTGRKRTSHARNALYTHQHAPEA